MAKRNPGTPHRYVAGNAERTQARVDQYHGLEDLLRTWEALPDRIQIRNHAYIMKLRARVRNVKAYVQHRGGADAEL